MWRLFKLAVLLAIAPVIFSGSAGAGPDASSHVSFNHSTVRLINGGLGHDAELLAGVEIKLEPGWKTYWRVPGAAGLPPQFSWTGSGNLADIQLAWPAPGRYDDATGETIGYKDHVLFPLKVRAGDSSKPVHLKLNLFYAVCNDICVPVTAKVSLVLGMTSPPAADRTLIANSAALVPAPDSDAITVESLKIVPAQNGPLLRATLSGQVRPAATDIFVEGANEVYFRKPRFKSTANGSTVFDIPIHGLDKPEVLSGRVLKLTILSGDVRLVQEAPVD